MSKVTTSDCKKLLVKHYPETAEKEWKRLSKYKNVDEQDVREFQHPTLGKMLVIDFEDELEIVDEDAVEGERLHKKRGASDYIFSVADKGYSTLEDLIPDSVTVMMTPLKFWEKNRYMNDQPDYAPENFLPKEWEAEDINECGTWLFQTTLNKDEVKQTLISLGCVWTQEFDDFINKIDRS